MEQVSIMEYLEFLENHPRFEHTQIETTECKGLLIQLVNLDGKRIAECAIGKTFEGYAIRKN